MSDVAKPDEAAAEPTPTEDLTRSKAELLRSAAKVLGIVSIAVLPAIVGWIDAKAKATQAVAATATESATSDMAYTKLVDRLNRTEDDMRKLSVDVAAMRILLGPKAPAVAPPPVDAAMTFDPPAPNDGFAGAAAVEVDADGLREPVPKLSSARPKPSQDAIDAAQTRIEKKSAK